MKDHCFNLSFVLGTTWVGVGTPPAPKGLNQVPTYARKIWVSFVSPNENRGRVTIASMPKKSAEIGNPVLWGI